MNEDHYQKLHIRAVIEINKYPDKYCTKDELAKWSTLGVFPETAVSRLMTSMSIRAESANTAFPITHKDFEEFYAKNPFQSSTSSQPNQASSKESKMDKNLFAIAQDNLITVECRFSTASNLYTYVTNLKGLQSGDLVIVEGPKSGDLVNAFSSTSNLAVVEVVNVHTSCKIDPEEAFRYKFILGTVNQSCGQQIIKDYTEFYDQINQAYKANMRAQVRAQVKAVIAGQASPEVLGMTKTED